MRIAIIGTGIAGNLLAMRLSAEHDITVFEADSRIGGHTNTVTVESDGRSHAIDTGFIVHNDRTYPHFEALLDELGVATQDSDMSFSVRCENSGLEYCGSNLNTLFAQRSNVLRPSFHRMLRDILRFNRDAPALLQGQTADVSLDDYLRENRFSREFINHYIIPMGAAIWSATPDGMGSVPAGFFVRFFHNHGLLSLDDRPQWRVIEGGSNQYLEKLIAGHRDRIRTCSPVRYLKRRPGHVELKADGCEAEYFDKVFIACHSDQALRLLSDATEVEREVLDAIEYQHNEAVLHTDSSLLPRRRRAWASWNYHIRKSDEVQDERVALTYHMNRLQSLDASEEFCVTLNHSDAIDQAKVIETISYEHPIFTERAVLAQQRHREINGSRNCYFSGAYWRYGFHEDGVVSAINALKHFESDLRSMGAERAA